MTYQLVSPNDRALWKAYHDIRRIVLFEHRGRFGVYNPDHPDEFKPNHFPKVLLFKDMPVGVIRIDINGKTVRFRRVAIAASQQRFGHGRVLLEMSEFFAIEHLAEKAEASVAADAIGFYRRCGYKVLRVLDQAGSMRMVKRLGDPYRENEC